MDGMHSIKKRTKKYIGTFYVGIGVLLLNAVLTVEAHKANSHKNRGWEKITDAVIHWISKNLSSVVFLLWGADAQKKAAMVDRV